MLTIYLNLQKNAKTNKNNFFLANILTIFYIVNTISLLIKIIFKIYTNNGHGMNLLLKNNNYQLLNNLRMYN